MSRQLLLTKPKDFRFMQDNPCANTTGLIIKNMFPETSRYQSAEQTTDLNPVEHALDLLGRRGFSEMPENVRNEHGFYSEWLQNFEPDSTGHYVVNALEGPQYYLFLIFLFTVSFLYDSLKFFSIKNILIYQFYSIILIRLFISIGILNFHKIVLYVH